MSLSELELDVDIHPPTHPPTHPPIESSNSFEPPRCPLPSYHIERERVNSTTHPPIQATQTNPGGEDESLGTRAGRGR